MKRIEDFDVTADRIVNYQMGKKKQREEKKHQVCYNDK